MYWRQSNSLRKAGNRRSCGGGNLVMWSWPVVNAVFVDNNQRNGIKKIESEKRRIGIKENRRSAGMRQLLANKQVST